MGGIKTECVNTLCVCAQNAIEIHSVLIGDIYFSIDLGVKKSAANIIATLF